MTGWAMAIRQSYGLKPRVHFQISDECFIHCPCSKSTRSLALLKIPSRVENLACVKTFIGGDDQQIIRAAVVFH
jgi:hypothetical protein